jgi:hypothetical protein
MATIINWLERNHGCRECLREHAFDKQYIFGQRILFGKGKENSMVL